MIVDAPLPDVLAARAAAEPSALGFLFLNEYEEETDRLTYGELHTRALAIAGALAGAGAAPGERALLLFPQCLDFISAYFGCLYAGVVAVPVSPPRAGRLAHSTLSVVRDCQPAVVLTVAAMADVATAAAAEAKVRAVCLAVDELGPVASGAAAGPPVAAEPDALAFLQYTSGSTADPKGVMVTHRNLAANMAMIRSAMGHDEHSTFVGWTPFFHDQGLIGNILQPLHLGVTSVLMAPSTFIRWPLNWLTAISRYRAHTSGGPNFAFDVCVARAARSGVPDIDLSCWKVAFNGAEPIRETTLGAFAATFGPVGFDAGALYPCYGLAEGTLLVTGSRKGRGRVTITADADVLGTGRYAPADSAAGGARARTLVGSGLVSSGVPAGPAGDPDVRIVEPETHRACPDGEIGEIWVAGGHVARGYYRRPETSAETFGARLTPADPLDPLDPLAAAGPRYLRTGDLGLVADGELYVVGRRKDLVIIRGRNHYPQDIEATVVAAHPALRPDGAAAFPVPGPDVPGPDESGSGESGSGESGSGESEPAERLVVVAEIRGDARASADPVEVTQAIRAALTREHDLALADLVLTLPGRLPKTTSGKIMRTAARRRYLDGGFDRWSPPRAAALRA